MVLAVLVSLSMLATSGLVAAPASAQGAAQFVFEGAGWGHGVGMSQNGARNAANNGLNHVEILNHYYPNTIVSPIPTLDRIRVHVGDAERVEMSSEGSMVFERGGVAVNALASGTIMVSAHDGGLQIGSAWTTASRSDPVYVSFPQPVKLSNNGHRYLWGKFQLTVKNGKVRVVEVLALEDYVAGIAEMPAAWPLEALMAQAIAARTYAHEITLHRRNSTEWAQEYDISGSTVDQNYIGYDAQDSAWDQKWLAAVSSTSGVEIIDANGPIRAYYSATNGGYTETADYVFSNNVPYTVAGPDPYDEGGHDWTTWTRAYSQTSMSRWLNASADTSVGTVTAINVLDGAGASARIDKSTVEIVGSNGTKRVTGRRLMLVINAGVFGEGGGLSTHLPGTFTTVGNGIGAGPPQPTGAAVVAVATPDPVADDAGEIVGFTPPPGWEPEPGTGIAPGVDPIEADDATSDDENQAEDPDGAFVPPEGWVPEPGTGVAPGTSPDSALADAAASDAMADSDTAPIAPSAEGFAPPPGWEPTPGTGIAPEPRSASASPEAESTIEAAPATAGAGYVPPEGWTPEAGTGVPPGEPVAPSSSEPAPTPAPTPETASESATPAATTQSQPASPASAATNGDFVPPADWTPEAGTGIAPGTDTSTVGGTGGGDALASGVFLVTRSAEGTDLADPKFEVIAPTADLAEEARARVEGLQAKAALGLFANVDIDGYVESVAPRPVRGVCRSTNTGVVCVPISALEED